SFVRLRIDARAARSGATVRFVPSERLRASAPGRLLLGNRTRLVVSRGARLTNSAAEYRIPAGSDRTIYVAWLNAPSGAARWYAGAAASRPARDAVVSFWRSQLAGGASFEVPEPAVENAVNGVLVQLIAYDWRYSIGNPYEELSYAESLDAAEVAA